MTTPMDGPLCFVVTRNHGSLIDTMAFLHGTELVHRSVLLLPPDLHATHSATLSVPSHQYRSFQDLAQWIERERPSLVFLFCGYLLTSQGLLTAARLKQLLRLLEARHCPVVTNDPCWGLLASRMPMESGLAARGVLNRLIKRWVEWLIPHKLHQSYRVLKDQIHSYPVPVEQASWAKAYRTVAHFNPRLLASFGPGDEASSAAGNGRPGPPEGPYWLFILASLDYNIQVTLHGKEAFIEGLVSHLRQANSLDRRAVLVAPDDCIAAVREAGSLPEVSLIGFCDYQRYVSLLLFAEYAFYWNIASSSSFFRLANGLPVFFFDQGHVSRWFQAFYDRTVELVYCGHTPTILNHREPLVPERLQSLARAYREHAQDLVQQLKLLPTPDDMVARLLDARSQG